VPIRICRLGSPRLSGEGPRIGAVRFLPRGVPKTEYSSRDLFDSWLPTLAPSAELLRWFREEPLSEARWRQFARKYRAEMAVPEVRRLLEVLALFSRSFDFSVGCYCEDERHCHRSLLRPLLEEAGAEVRPEDPEAGEERGNGAIK
jgi:uncharacterized protein YeaO (DUF488 family)